LGSIIYLKQTIRIVISALASNNALDEALAWVYRCIENDYTYDRKLPEEIVIPLVTVSSLIPVEPGHIIFLDL